MYMMQPSKTPISISAFLILICLCCVLPSIEGVGLSKMMQMLDVMQNSLQTFFQLRPCLSALGIRMYLQFQDVTLNLLDSAGQEDYRELRVLGYNNTDCFVLCFSVAGAVTFGNIESVWLPEIRSRQPKAKILLVGTKSDLKNIRTSSTDQHQKKVKISFMFFILGIVADLS